MTSGRGKRKFQYAKMRMVEGGTFKQKVDGRKFLVDCDVMSTKIYLDLSCCQI